MENAEKSWIGLDNKRPWRNFINGSILWVCKQPTAGSVWWKIEDTTSARMAVQRIRGRWEGGRNRMGWEEFGGYWVEWRVEGGRFDSRILIAFQGLICFHKSMQTCASHFGTTASLQGIVVLWGLWCALWWWLLNICVMSIILLHESLL